MTATTPAVRSIPFFNYKGAFSADEDAYLAIVSDVIGAARSFSSATLPTSRSIWPTTWA